MCISPRYKEDADASQLANRDLASIKDIPADPHRCRTRYLQRQMQAEYTLNCCRNKRFRPIIFPGALIDHLPTWLKNTKVYYWPDHWKDICFNLSKPHLIIQNYKRSMTLSSGNNSDHSDSFNSVTMRATTKNISLERSEVLDKDLDVNNISVGQSDSRSDKGQPDIRNVSVGQSDSRSDKGQPDINDVSVGQSDSRSIKGQPDISDVSVRQSDGSSDIWSPVIVTKKSGSIVL